MNKAINLPTFVFLSMLCAAQQAHAQFTVSGQVRTRTEMRNGQGTVQVKDTVPGIFTSQRTRLNFGYAGHRFKIFTAVQDVRVWGQDGSTLTRISTDVNDGVMLHEAWAEVSLVDTGKVIKNFTLKLGRQELVYDDSRLLGNLDWLQQARRHDAAVLKFDHNGWTAHLGAAYNQNAERKSNTIYNGAPVGYPVSTNGLGSMYKSMQFLYVAKKLHFGNASFLAFKDDFSKFSFAAADVNKTTPIYEQKVWSRYTVGANMFGTAFRKLGFAVSAFYQGGNYRDGTALDEYFASLSTQYALGRKLSIGPGVDVTSGNNGSDPSQRFKHFDPLYGTPHKFWGLMDYFYVADGFGANGLTNYYLKAKYKAKDNLILSLDGHHFQLPSAVTAADGTEMSKSLGTELDLVLNYAVTKAINIEGGYSMMFSTPTMASPKVKNVKRAAETSSWAYLMISIKPADFKTP
jgi:Alginate export